MWGVSIRLKYLPNKSNNKHYFRLFCSTIFTSRFQLNFRTKSIAEVLQSRLTSFSKNIPMNRDVNLCQIRYKRLLPRTSIQMSAWVTLKTTESHFLFQLSSYSPYTSNRKRCPWILEDATTVPGPCSCVCLRMRVVDLRERLCEFYVCCVS